MAKYKIKISKPANTRTTYVHHGTENPQGGYGGTSDAGWSYRMAIRHELGRLPMDATEVDIIINGKTTETRRIP